MASFADLLWTPPVPKFVHAMVPQWRARNRVRSGYNIVLKDWDEDEKLLVHYSWRFLDAVRHLSRPLQPTDLRFPRATATENFEEAWCLTEGLYVWEMYWPLENRGSHALVGVATRGGLLYPMKRKAGGKPSEHRSWGWDIVTKKWFFDGNVHKDRRNDELHIVPEIFQVVVDMTAGTLTVIENGRWLETPLSGIGGRSLYPIAISRQGNCRIWRWLRL